MQVKEACKCWELFDNNPSELQHSIPYKGKGRRQNRRPPFLNNELLCVLKSKKEAYNLWRSDPLCIKDYRSVARACKVAIGEAKDQGWKLP